MSEPRWTAETEALVAQRIAQDCAARWGYDTTLGEKLPEWLAKQGNGTNTLADVRSALAALADAGLLVQPAAEALAGLRQELDEARAERDRLRAVVDEAETWRWVLEPGDAQRALSSILAVVDLADVRTSSRSSARPSTRDARR